MPSESQKPNILWLIVDHMAFAGHYRQHLPDYHWPQLETVARQGIWYERAYTTVPVCTPARASLMTGQRPGKHGLRWNPEYNILQNLQDFRPDQRLFNHRLAEQGYQTAFVGKWHCGRKYLPKDYGMSGWSMPDYGNVYGCDEYKAYLHELGLAQPTCQLDHQLFDPEMDGQEVLMDPPEPWTYMDGCGVLQGNERAQEQFFVAHRAQQELNKLQDSTEPWCMVASFWGPHHPYIPSASFAAQVDPTAIQPYPSFTEDLNQKPFRFGIHRDLRCDFRAHERWPDWGTWQTVLARCYAQGLQTDAAIGQLISALDATGQADNTLLIVTADHGDAIASHGAGWDKYSTYTEEVGRVPLVMRWPQRIAAGQRSKTLVSGLDITASLVAAANADTSGLDGRDLLAQDGELEDAEKPLIVEHYGHSGDIAFQRIVYAGDWKYVVAWGDDDEFYNLADDPYELANRLHDAAVADDLRRLQQFALDDLLQERAAREKAHPQSEMEFKLVVSNDRWPREERLLQYKLERALDTRKIHPSPPLLKEGACQQNQVLAGAPPPLKKGERGGFKAFATPSIPPGWQDALAAEFDQPHMQDLQAFLVAETAAGKHILPAEAQRFNALQSTALADVKVVILGQDPYPTPGHAHGLSFSVQPEVKPLPRSLGNINKELLSDLGIDNSHSGYLQPWAQQGVLLLNTVLSVEAGNAGSHQKRGWENVTDAVIRAVSTQAKASVFILWGKQAQKKTALIEQDKHAIIATAHPSPLSARRGFFGSRPFSQANHFLQQQGRSPIDWALPK